MSIQNVVLVGVDGTLGPVLLHALVENGFNVTIIKRQSSKSTSSYPNEVRVADDFPVDELTEVLRGKDAVVVSMRPKQIDVQKRLADASVKAGVKRFIPADFGSVDSSSARVQALVPLYRSKTEVREHLQRLAAGASPAGSFSWTSIVCGHFFDWSTEFLHLWPAQRRAHILDDGAAAWSASTLARIAEATARVLRRPDATRDRIVYVQSFLVTQNQVVAAFERATGGAPWEVTRFDAAAFEAERKPKADAGDAEATEDLVWLLGALDADWTKKENFAMQELGLADEDLDRVVARMVKDAKS